ncbi:MAG: DNA repair exonuclease [Candidatus Bathyarchaeota archaeon]|nr:DNA repair exonuclease [Candidatus Bathyarchaeota archaeon]
MKPFSFVHVADLHLGYEQYNLAARREDFDRAFHEVVEKTVELKPDFMIIAGDLFHQARPSNATLEKAIKNFSKLREAGIPVLVVDGSHDAAPNIITGTILNPLDSAGLLYYLPRHENACWENEDCYVYGIPNFRTRQRTEMQLPKFYEVKKPKPRPVAFNIFVFHMALDIPAVMKRHHTAVAEASPNYIPDGFDYYAGGHLHTPWQIPFKRASLVYSGSTETVSYEDAKTEKGFYHVEVNQKDDLEISRVKLETPRPFKILEKDFTGLSPQKVTELVAEMVKEADEPGRVIVPVLKGTLPLESTRRQIDLAKIRAAAEQALVVRPLVSMSEKGIPVETIRSIFEGEMKDLKTKSFEYFLQYLSQRHKRKETERYAHLSLDLIPLLVKGDEERARALLEGTVCEG